MAFPSSDMSKWPAIRLAVRRTHSVMGRIRLLTSSMITIKFMRAAGVPWGSRWESMWFVFFVHPKVMMVSHVVRERVSVIGRCAVTEKFCGYSAVRFINRIVVNIKIRMASIPFAGLPSE